MQHKLNEQGNANAGGGGGGREGGGGWVKGGERGKKIVRRKFIIVIKSNFAQSTSTRRNFGPSDFRVLCGEGAATAAKADYLLQRADSLLRF